MIELRRRYCGGLSDFDGGERLTPLASAADLAVAVVDIVIFALGGGGGGATATAAGLLRIMVGVIFVGCDDSK